MPVVPSLLLGYSLPGTGLRKTAGPPQTENPNSGLLVLPRFPRLHASRFPLVKCQSSNVQLPIANLFGAALAPPLRSAWRWHLQDPPPPHNILHKVIRRDCDSLDRARALVLPSLRSLVGENTISFPARALYLVVYPSPAHPTCIVLRAAAHDMQDSRFRAPFGFPCRHKPPPASYRENYRALFWADLSLRRVGRYPSIRPCLTSSTLDIEQRRENWPGIDGRSLSRVTFPFPCPCQREQKGNPKQTNQLSVTTSSTIG
ncbi:hypothetical protein B0I37DRAFT_363145 [Chaetomium sp. MPI-CAGE-AT-0009]|nr:hypothetical protein B0I37DRAFT_363145 [Chaetomium sp. MPI-CAGE-AT-0009]